MNLALGTGLGHYQIVGPLGAGGPPSFALDLGANFGASSAEAESGGTR